MVRDHFCHIVPLAEKTTLCCDAKIFVNFFQMARHRAISKERDKKKQTLANNCFFGKKWTAQGAKKTFAFIVIRNGY